MAEHELDIGNIEFAEFQINFKPNIDVSPIVCNEYPHSRIHTEEIERQLNELIKAGKIRESLSPWRFPTFVVPKKTGDVRIVFDYRLLNEITVPMEYSLPNMKYLISKFKDKHWISTFDIKSGYWHIKVRKQDVPKLAFVFNNKLYEWLVMPFGPRNAPAYFQYVMNQIFKPYSFVIVYMDDITIVSDTLDQHIKHIKIIFNVFKKYKIKLRMDKCVFGMHKVEYLGFMVDRYGISITDKYISKILKVPRPRNKKQLQRFIGLVTYLHSFIPNIYKYLLPLNNMIKNNVPFQWTNDINNCFEYLKNIIQQGKYLIHPDYNKEFFVVCDASNEGIGGMLAQYCPIKKQLLPVEFASKTFSDIQKRWHCSEQEIFAVIYFCEKWRSILLPKPFTVYTDHLNLKELFNKSQNFKSGKLYRWAVRLQDYSFTAKYIKGNDNNFADYLSRDALTKPHPAILFCNYLSLMDV